MKRTKSENVILSFLFIDLIIVSTIILFAKIDFNISNINFTNTQGNMMLTLGITYLLMLMGVLFWQEWAMYGMLSSKVLMSIIMIIGSKFNYFVLVYQIIILILVMILMAKLILTKLNYKDNL
ncbi:hypothetical protein [Clostridium fallax]|uniref:Uncharacterized protein n=1 Tax=Clostridium fallax TaxID=1533 RepID=A0A1M4UI82_9CLOT|nr:hypothetical protein [Clostridium fallax]SHE56375.1 hypothetical protein SAMN05443638_10530 [Clostridium fallax]SQB07575.1 Uncharacterised protein [Clostridium fallax]